MTGITESNGVKVEDVMSIINGQVKDIQSFNDIKSVPEKC